MEDGSETSTSENFDAVVIGWLEELDKKFEAVEKKVKEYSIMDLAGSVVCPKCEEEGCISIQIRCNACGVRMGMGWYPPAS